MISMELFEYIDIESFKITINEKITSFNANFTSRVTAINGYFGEIDGLSKIIKKETGWSDEIVNAINTPAEFNVLKRANLIETEIGGRRALISKDINWRQIDEFGRTNLQRIENGLSPIAKDGNTKIELHHIGQGKDAPLAETTRAQHNEIPNINKESEIDRSVWDKERKAYWKARAESDITRRQVFTSTVKTANEIGLKSGLYAGVITAAISTVDNVQGIISGEITTQEAAINIAKDTGTAAALGYGTGFITSAVAMATSSSSHAVIRSLGSAGVTAATISFGTASYDSVVSYAQGEITSTELVYDLGKNAIGVAGSMAGAALTGAATGAVAGPVGAVAGGLIGGMVGYTIATGAYITAIEVATGGAEILVEKAETLVETASNAYSEVSSFTIESVQAAENIINPVVNSTLDFVENTSIVMVENVEVLKDKAVEIGQGVLDLVAESAPEALESIKTAMNDFTSSLKLPFNF